MVCLTVIEKYMVFFTIFYIPLRGQLFFMAISTRKIEYTIIIVDLTI